MKIDKGKWEIRKLGEVCDVRDGTHDSPKGVEIGYPLITSKNLVNGDIDFFNVSFISDLDFENINKRSKVDVGDIIMPMIGTIGNPVIVNVKKEFAIKNVALIKFINQDINNKFIKYTLESSVFKRYIEKENRGGTQKFISLTNIRKFEFNLPSTLKEQQHIAKILDTISDIINLHKKSLEELDKLIQSTFYEMFGDPISNDRGWSVGKFSEIMILQRGFDLPVSDRCTDGDIDVYGANGIIGKHNQYKVKNGGVITGRSGTIGKVYYTFDDFWALNTTLFTKETKGNNIIYLAYLLLNFKVERFSVSTSVPTLNRNLIHSENIISVPLPLQEKFANIVNHIEQQKAIVNKALLDSQMLFESLMQDFFE